MSADPNSNPNPNPNPNPNRNRLAGRGPYTIDDFRDPFGPEPITDDAAHRLYTGNGLNVDPNRRRHGSSSPPNRDQHIRDLMRQAAEQGAREQQRSEHFSGTGYVLGDDETPAQVLPGAVVREMTIWQNGFSFPDGRFVVRDPNDQAQNRILQQLQDGHAPREWLDVGPGQQVELRLKDKSGEVYRGDGRKTSLFGGPGFQVGTAPSAEESSAAEARQAAAAQSIPRGPGSVAGAAHSVDRSLPILRIRFALPTGSQTVEYNESHTIEDLYDYVAQSEAGDFRLVLPGNVQLEDAPTVLSDHPVLKKGGLVRVMRR